MLDLLIKGGTVVDGSGREPFVADVGILGDRIAGVGFLSVPAAQVIDAAGLLVAPGFIDAHGHSDFALAFTPEASSQAAQGVTTQITGNCGFSAFPICRKNRHLFFDPPGFEVDWHTLNDYVERVGGTGMNAASLTGHNTIRKLAVGEDRTCTPSELEHMKHLLAETMEMGSFGLSSGLQYEPSTTATREELIELLTVVGKYGGVYATHLRSYAPGQIEAAVEEAMDIAYRAGVSCILSHLMIHSRAHWGSADRVLELIDHWRRRGLPVWSDTIAQPMLGPWWAHPVIFREHYDHRAPWEVAAQDLAHRIRTDRKLMTAIVHESLALDKSTFSGQFFSLHDWETVVVEEVSPDSRWQEYVGWTLQSIADRLGEDPIDLYLTMLAEEQGNFSAVLALTREEDHFAMVRAPHTMFGSDIRTGTPESASEPWMWSPGSPRQYGEAVHILKTLVRDRGILGLPEAVRKLTSLPASCFGLRRRGLIRAGMIADIVVFDLYRLRELATNLYPDRYPMGVEHTFVSGRPVLSDRELTGARPGGIIIRN